MQEVRIRITPAGLTEEQRRIRDLAHDYAERTDVPRIIARICANPVDAFVAGYAMGVAEAIKGQP